MSSKEICLKEFDRLFEIVKTLRGENGCPWDREQTPESMTGDLLEETYETVEAIEDDKRDDIREELGDMFFLAVFITWLYSEKGLFTIQDVLNDVAEKLVRRHPHVFGALDEKNIDKILVNWESIKSSEAKNSSRKSVFDGIPKRLPEIQKFYKILEKARRAGLEADKVTENDLLDSMKEFLKNRENASLSNFLEKFLTFTYLEKKSLLPMIRTIGRKKINSYNNSIKH